MACMDVSPEPLSDLALLLPREAFYEILWMLRGVLPPPLTEDPTEEARRDRAAMAAVAELLPVTVPEGRLAAQFVMADSWARDCLRQAGERRRQTETARKCQAQAVSLMREAKSALRELRQLQTSRQKREASEAAMNRAEWAELSALGMMRTALGMPDAAGTDGKYLKYRDDRSDFDS